METLAVLIALSGSSKKQSNSVSGLLVSQKRLETKIQKEQHLKALEILISLSGSLKKQSNSVSGLLVSPARLEAKI